MNTSANALTSLTDYLQNSQNSEHDSEQNNADAGSTFVKRRGRPIPPLHKWNPDHCGSMDLVVKSNGEWWHEGSKITRQSLVDLFATVLWKEEADDKAEYYLKTPVEKISIEVEDVPFFVTKVSQVTDSSVDQASEATELTWLEFDTSTGDVIRLDADHPLTMRQFEGQNRPYIPVRFGMQGVLARSVYMHLIEMGELTDDGNTTVLSLQSGGQTYKISAPSFE